MSTADPRPRLALVGPVVRADLCAAFRHFRRFEPVNFYQEAGGDLAPGDLDGQIRYRGDWDLYQKLLAVRPALIQGSEPLWFPTATRVCVVARAAARRLGVPYFFPMLENRPIALRFLGWRRPVGAGLRRLLGWYGRGAVAVFALNRGAEANLRAAGVPAEKVRRLMWGCWGVDTGEYAPDPHGPCREPRLLFVGRLVSEKGLEDLVEAFRVVRVRVPAARLRVIGEGPLGGWLKARAVEFGGALEVAGPKLNREMPDEFRRAMVTVTPSRTVRNWEEQVGMVNLQSLACGVPVVSTRSGAIPEYVRDGIEGLLVPERDPGALASAILQLLGDQGLRQRMGAAAREGAVARYDLAANVARSEGILLELLWQRAQTMLDHKVKTDPSRSHDMLRTRLAECVRRASGYRFPRLGANAVNSFVRLMPRRVETELFPGIEVELDLDDSTQRATYWQGERYERPTAQILAQWAKEHAEYFFDIGSNYGFFSYWLLSKSPQLNVHAFEPNPKTFALAQRIKDHNRLDRLRIWNLGLSDEPARLALHAGLTDSGHSTFGKHPGLKDKLAEIEVLPFDVWRARAGLSLPKHPSWTAKIDVEGFELKVLRGMSDALRAKAFHGLVVEINDFTLEFCGTTRPEIFNFMKSFGYEPMPAKIRHATDQLENVFFVLRR